jgi:AmmeMemoRadiSam system protein B
MTDLESLPDHIRKPDLRPIQPIPVEHNGQRLFALRDPIMLGKQTMIVPPQALMVLKLFRGQTPIEEIAEQLSGDLDKFVELAQGLDRFGLLWGPTFEKLETELTDRIHTNGAIPAGASKAMGDDDDACREKLKSYFDDTEDPELEAEVVGLVAPHIDYDRGWPNYAAAYYALQNREKPDRIVILGTNHFGLGDGVVMTQYGFDSPMGRCPADSEVIGKLVDTLGQPAIVDQLDHLGEHSIQLQLPWLQYCWGDLPIVAALLPDPLTPMLEDEGRVDSQTFCTALRDVLDEIGGQTFFIASSDLSHVGPHFGEPRPVDDQRKMDVEQHDRDMLAKFMTGDAEEFLAAMNWNRNPTRWCSVGNMASLLEVARPQAVELIDYRQACDDQGVAMVSSAAIVLH